MGLAERRRHRDDRRKHAVHLTARGRAHARARAAKSPGRWRRRSFAPLDAGELETLRAAAAQARRRRELTGQISV